jgi:hypothetical protein
MKIMKIIMLTCSLIGVAYAQVPQPTRALINLYQGPLQNTNPPEAMPAQTPDQEQQEQQMQLVNPTPIPTLAP